MHCMAEVMVNYTTDNKHETLSFNVLGLGCDGCWYLINFMWVWCYVCRERLGNLVHEWDVNWLLKHLLFNHYDFDFFFGDMWLMWMIF